MYVRVCACALVFLYIYTCVYICVYIFTFMYTHTHVDIHKCNTLSLSLSFPLYLYIRTHSPIHAHMHTRALAHTLYTLYTAAFGTLCAVLRSICWRCIPGNAKGRQYQLGVAQHMCSTVPRQKENQQPSPQTTAHSNTRVPAQGTR